MQEVVALLDREPEQQDKNIIEDVSSSYPGWVRDFTLQYLSKPFPFEYADEPFSLHQGEDVLILFEPAEQHITEQLEVSFHQFSAKVECFSFAEARQKISSLLTRFSRVIALLPHQETSEPLDQQTLVAHVTRLHTIFSPSFYRIGLKKQALAVVQFGDGFFGDGPVSANINRCSAKALAASLHLEQPDLKVRVLDFFPQISTDQLCEYIMAELTTTESYTAVGYAADQIRRVPRPVLRNVAADEPRPLRWSPKDIVLATGGAKGITAECVLALARVTGVQLALVGSSSPSMGNDQHDEQQDEILNTLKRAHQAGLSAHYYQCDVTDAEAVNRLVRQVEKEQGAITGVIHGSALNRPSELNNVSVEQALEEISPKIIGATNLCTALRDHPPKLFIAFSSLIGISGMRQNGWYGFSNEALHLLLRQYGEAQPGTATLSIAFSIWDEVGMGVRMGSISRLHNMGVDALSVQQGTSRFLQLVTHDPAADQVIVAARSTGSDTFPPPEPAFPQCLRFIDKVTVYQPGVEIISRTRLTLEDDPYLKDHCWRGSYLFPLVFGLEAMAQAVRTVTGKTCFDAVCIEDIELARPIVLSEDIGTEIEIHALVIEQDDLETDPHVQVQIRTEQTDFSVDHFSAIFVLRSEAGSDSPSVRLDLPEQLPPLDIVPEIDLYKEELLFQGPLYQRIQQVFQLASDICLFTTVPSSEMAGISDHPWILGDPFCRDSFLQSGQVAIPRDLCLPVHIRRIERYPVAIEGDESVWGKAVIEEHAEKYIDSAVTVFNKQGRVIERITGYRARIIEHKKESPTAEDLVYPGQRDCKILLSELKQRATLLPAHCMLPEFISDFIPQLQHLSKDERRRAELPFIKNALAPLLDSSNTRIEISWSQEGKPALAIPTDAGVYFSLTHNEGTIVCTAGQELQGCDLEAVSSRSKEEWQSILGKGNETILAELTEQDDQLNQAGTRLWTTFEAIFKALEIQPDASMLRIVEKKDDTVLFSYGDCCILTFPVRFTLRGERMLAVVVPEKCRKSKMSEHVPVSSDADVRSNQVGSFTHEFITTFLEGRGSQGKVYFTNIPVWMGELRELALLPIADLLVQDMKSRQCGMVTNRSFFSVDQQLDSYDTVIGEVRLLQDTDLSRSFLSLGFNWFKKKEDGSLIRVASGKLSTTWVTVKGHGKVQLANLPDYFNHYFEGLPLAQDDSEPPAKKRHSFFSKASPLLTATVSTRRRNILFQQQFLTSQEDSNLVGNIYFSNYYSWQARVRDQYIATKLPNISSRNFFGDFVCVYAEVYHLQEAMPFEIIEVSMYLYECFSEGFTLYFEYYSVNEYGARLRKLAHGEHSAVWVLKGQELSSEIHPVKMPEEYVAHFMTTIDNSE
ncbi:MAG: SDR family NAD(P)-dependent oxidoreductase [Candidatus Electrothrix sp. GM3_4]|nr:SDR family NAD(P)-dependent oxidoreductase [Candidatus Electrothrix sp. GM3_4]